MIKNPNRKKDGKIFFGIIVVMLFVFATISNNMNYADVFIVAILIQIRYDLLEMFWNEEKDKMI